jgi:hypothetical protein
MNAVSLNLGVNAAKWSDHDWRRLCQQLSRKARYSVAGEAFKSILQTTSHQSGALLPTLILLSRIDGGAPHA